MINRMIESNTYLEDIQKLLIKLLIKSHFIIKDKSDISSVSLREISRFGKIFNFFLNYLEERNIWDKQLNLSKEKIIEDSIILSLYFCYFLKIPRKKIKKEYLDEIKLIKGSWNFNEVFKRESNFIADQVLNNESGYAKNLALKGNLFCLFVCIINKEPLIIFGKPGVGKSLSVKLLFNAMMGEKSKSEFFKKYGVIIPAFYQCSLASTSYGLQKIFDRAKDRAEKSEDKKNIFLVFMDEMAIADESKNNPLKIIHTELDKNLEKDDKDKIAFVGLSNYSLDSSKMGRVYNKCMDEQEEIDIFETSKEIADSIGLVNKFNENIIKMLSQSYDYYINIHQPNKGKIKDFHGLRDYYCLIKYIFNKNYYYNNILSEKNLDFVFEGIYRNFGGQDDSINVMKDKFMELYQNQKEYRYDYKIPLYDVVKCIKENIDDHIKSIDSRYLLLITKNEVADNILKDILKNKKYIFISKEDIDNYETKYIIKLLLQIQIYLEQELILVLKNLEVIYPSLYELFNKSFTQHYNKKFTKLCHEDKQTLVYVNDKFRIIILVDEKKLNLEEKPFLNRFEKHKLNFEILLNEKAKKITNELYDCLNKFINFKNINLENHLIIKDKEAFKYIVFTIIRKFFQYDDDKLKEELLLKLVPLFTQEMINLLKFNKLEKINNSDIEHLVLQFKENYKNNYKNNYNFKSFISKLKNDKKVNVIYTFSKRDQVEFKIEKMSQIDFKYDKNNPILEDIKKFNEDEKKNYLIININDNINMKEKILLNKIIRTIDEYIIFDKSNTDKYFIFIVYKNRLNTIDKNEIKNNNDENQENKNVDFINLFLNYNQLFIDNLNSNYNELDIHILMGNKNIIYDNEKLFEKIIDNSFKDVTSNLEDINIIKKELKQNKNILKLIKNKLRDKFNIIIESNFEDILSGKIKVEGNENFIEKYKKKIIEDSSETLKKLFKYLEEDLSLTNVLFSPIKNELEDNFKEDLDKFDMNKDYGKIKNIIYGFNLPLYKSFNSIMSAIKMLEKENEQQKMIDELQEVIFSDSKLKEYLKLENKYSLVYEDYLLYFILTVFKRKINEIEKQNKIIKFLDKILENSSIKNSFNNENKNENVENLAKIVVFLHSNKNLLSWILFIFLDFIDIKPDFLEKFELTKFNDEKDYLNKMAESFFDVITDNGKFNYYKDKNKDKYIEILNKNLLLFKNISREISNNSYIQRIEIFINLIINNSIVLLEWILKNYNNIEDILPGLSLDNIKKDIDSNNLDYLSISYLFSKKYQNNNDKRFDIFNDYIKDKNLLKYSLSFFSNIFEKGYYYNFAQKKDNFLKEDVEFEKKINEILNSNSNDSNDLITELLIYYFEIYYQNYFFEKFENNKYSEILGGKSLDNLTNACKFYEVKYKKNIKSLKLLNIIGYIKSYFKYYSSIIYDCGNGNENFNFSSIDNELQMISNNEDYMKNLKVYIFELIFNKCQKNADILENFVNGKNIEYLKPYIKTGTNYIESIKNMKQEIKENYFKYNYEIPCVKLLKEKLNENEYKVLYFIINNSENFYKLNKLESINSITNIINDYLSYNKTKTEIEKTPLKDEKQNGLNYEDELMEQFIKNYNSLIKNKDDIIKEKNYNEYTLNHFIIDKDNSLYEIYKEFIKYQNEFLDDVGKCKTYENYVKNIEEIYIQDAIKNNILNIEENDLINIIIDCSIIDINNNAINGFNFNFDIIEKKLIEKMIPGIKRFIQEKYGIRIIKYKGDKYNYLNNEILYDFVKKIESKNINEKQKERIIDKMKDKNKDEVLLSIQSLMLSILENFKDVKEQESINDYLKVNNNIDNVDSLKAVLGIDDNIDEGENKGEDDDNDDDYLNAMNQGNNNKSQEELKIFHLYSIFEFIKNELKLIK